MLKSKGRIFDRIVIGADTIVYCDDEVLGKPDSLMISSTLHFIHSDYIFRMVIWNFQEITELPLNGYLIEEHICYLNINSEDATVENSIKSEGKCGIL